MPSLPSTHGQEIELSEKTKKALEAAKSHEAEAAGSALWEDPSALADGTVQRLALLNLISPMLLQMFPREAQLEIREAFKWSEYGHPTKFFDTPKVGKRLALRRLRLKALCCMEYDQAWRGWGSKTSINMDVAAAFGVKERVVRKWPDMLARQDKIDSQTIGAALARARDVGVRVREIKQAHPNYQVDVRTDAAFGQAAIERAGKQYQEIRRSRS